MASDDDRSHTDERDEPATAARPATGGKVDSAWMYCEMVDGSRQKTKCKYCGKILQSGGISRFKKHLVGGDKNVVKCKQCPDEIRKLIKKEMTRKDEKHQGEMTRMERFKQLMFGTSTTSRKNVVEIEDDEYVDDEAALRQAMKRSRQEAQEQAFRDEVFTDHRHRFGPSQYEVGGGSRRPDNFIDLESSQMQGLRSNSMRYTAGEPGFRTQGAKQRTIPGILKNTKDLVGQAIGKFLFASGIAPNVAQGPYMQNMIDVIAKHGKGVESPTPHELMNKYLPQEKLELEGWIEEMKEKKWPIFGLTLMCDGWTSGTRRKIINFMAYCDGETFFIKSVDASRHIKDHLYLAKLMESAIKFVGKENVVQICTDNGSNFKKAGKKLEESRHYNLFWTPCAAHCLDLILKDFGKLEMFKYVMPRARRITNYIYNRSYLLAMMRSKDYCGGDIVRPGITRFASNYIALQSLKQRKQGLKRIFVSDEWGRHPDSRDEKAKEVIKILNDDYFWSRVTKAVNIMTPVVRVLRMVDGDKSATMPYVYEAMRLMREQVEKEATNAKAQYLAVIDKRWDGMLLHPLHKAAYYLNPRYQYKHDIGMRGDLIMVVHEVINKLHKDQDKALTAVAQIKAFREPSGLFCLPAAVYARDRLSPDDWWMNYGCETDELRYIALRVLTQTAAAGGCERNWSTFNLIHTKRRNRLSAPRLHDLVYVYYNTRLKERHTYDSLKNPTADIKNDPLDWAYVYSDRNEHEDPLQAWMNENGEPLLDDGHPGGGPNATIATAMRCDLQDYQQNEGGQADRATLRVEPDGVESHDDYAQELPSDEAEFSSGNTTPEPSGSHGGGSGGGARYSSTSDDGNKTSDSHIRGDTPPYRTPSPRPYCDPGAESGYPSQSAGAQQQQEQPQGPQPRQYQRKGKAPAPAKEAKNQNPIPSPTTYGYGYGHSDWFPVPQPQSQPLLPHQIYQPHANVDYLAESVGSLSLGGGSSFVNELFGVPNPMSSSQIDNTGYFADSDNTTHGSRITHPSSEYSSYSFLGGYPSDPFVVGGSDTTSGIQSRYKPYISEIEGSRHTEPHSPPQIYVPPSDSDAERPPRIPVFVQAPSGSLAARYPAQLALYTRFGYLAEISDEDFATYVHDYEVNHSQQLTWMQYAMRIDDSMARLREIQSSQDGQGFFGRHSAYY